MSLEDLYHYNPSKYDLDSGACESSGDSTVDPARLGAAEPTVDTLIDVGEIMPVLVIGGEALRGYASTVEDRLIDLFYHDERVTPRVGHRSASTAIVGGGMGGSAHGDGSDDSDRDDGVGDRDDGSDHDVADAVPLWGCPSVRGARDDNVAAGSIHGRPIWEDVSNDDGSDDDGSNGPLWDAVGMSGAAGDVIGAFHLES